MGYQPTWKKHEKDANDPNDAEKALKASDAFEQERALEMKTSKLARDWETDRKKSWAKDKPTFVKNRIKKEQEALIAPLKSLKKGGSFDGSIKPMPGYLILEIIKKEQTNSGIVLPGEEESNSGVVVEISAPLPYRDSMIECPVKVGDKVLFKRGAGAFGAPGLELTLEGKDYRLMRWHFDPSISDLLGVFK